MTHGVYIFRGQQQRHAAITIFTRKNVHNILPPCTEDL